jgi:hypothetical protein
MATDTEIANLALSHLGIGKLLANLDTDRSEEGNVCRRFFDIAKDATLRDFSWPFATKFATLNLVEEDPTGEWGYSYRYPSDCLMLRRIISESRNDSRQSQEPYKIGQDDEGLLIYTDREDAEVEYTVRVTNNDTLPSDFVMAFSFRLATYIAPTVTNGDPFKLGDKAMQRYVMEMTIARASVVNEEQPDEEVQSEFIRARDS